ncbi:MAG: tetratricopeptide repeat protein [Chloroflexota bacterium]
MRQPDTALPAEDLALELALLCDALDLLTRGAFLFAICEEGPLRKRLMQQVREHLETEERQIIQVTLSPDRPDLAGQLEQRLLYMPARKDAAPAAVESTRDRPRPPVAFVALEGLAEPGDEGALRALRALNFQRERLSRLDAALVFWLSQNTLGQMAQHAADLFAARSGLFFFQAPLREAGAAPAMRAEAAVALLDRFHRTLLPPKELRRRASLYERRLGRQQAAETPDWPRVAALCRDLAAIYRELDDYEQAGAFQEQAIDAYQAAAAQPAEGNEAAAERAALLVWLGNAYAERIRGERAENIERAIGHYRQALEVYTRAAFPEDWAMTQNNLGNAYYSRIRGERAENIERAIGHYRQALEVYTRQAFPERWAGTQNNLGNAYAERIRGERAENIERAIGHYRQALEVYTRQAFPADWAGTQNNLGNAYYSRIRGERAENIERAIGHYRQALEVYTRQADPERWAAPHNGLGNVYYQLGRYDEAVAAYRRAIELDPDFAYPHNGLGNVYADLGRREEAIEAYKKAISLPDVFGTPASAHALAWNGLGNVYRTLGRYDEAVAAFRRAVELDPGYATPHNGLGNVYADLGRYDEAAAAYRRASELDPGYATPHNGLGNVYYQLGRYDEAVAAFRRAVELDPGYATPHNNLGSVYYQLGRYDEAVAAYRRAVELDPDFAHPHNGLGNVYAALGRYDEAAAAYRRASELDPNYATPHVGLAGVYRHMGHTEASKQHVERARQLLSPDDHYNKACIASIAGDVDAALEHLARALAHTPGNRDLARRDLDLAFIRDDPRFQELVGR